jgi:hypothetical protein
MSIIFTYMSIICVICYVKDTFLTDTLLVKLCVSLFLVVLGTEIAT